MESFTEQVARAVAAAMAVRNVSQVALSDATGIPRITLNRRLRALQPFTTRELEQIADHLGVPVSSFMETAA